jgi:phage-related protein
MPIRTKRRILPAVFYRTAAGSESVREWLKSLSRDDKRSVGQDIATVEFGWPVGMPHCRSLVPRRGLWEIRSSLTGNRIGRVLFFIHGGQMVLLHGFIKKTQQTPDQELDLAVKRKKEIENDEKTKE